MIVHIKSMFFTGVVWSVQPQQLDQRQWQLVKANIKPKHTEKKIKRNYYTILLEKHGRFPKTRVANWLDPPAKCCLNVELAITFWTQNMHLLW